MCLPDIREGTTDHGGTGSTEAAREESTDDGSPDVLCETELEEEGDEASVVDEVDWV